MATAVWRHATARVHAQSDFGDGHRWLDLDVPVPFVVPEPGQFVQLGVGGTRSSVLLPRPMSVCGARSVPLGVRLSFLYAAIGAGTHALAKLAPGEPVDVLGPLGRGYPLEAPGTPVLVAGGRGVAPLLFAAERLARVGARGRRGAPPLEFVFGARGAGQLVGLAAAKRRVTDAGGRMHVTTDDGSRGSRGTVLDLLEALTPRLSGTPVIHACGPHGMLRAVAEWALARDVRAYLAMESVMACGTGICRGCPLPRSEAGRARWSDREPSLHGNREYAMCCTEGPVFEARELEWEHVA